MNYSRYLSPTLPNSSDNTKEGNLPKPIRTSHDLTHSTRLPKPQRYNLKWSRVTLIQDALLTSPLSKHCIKTSIQSCVKSSTWSCSIPEIAWRITRVAWHYLVLDRLAVSSRRHVPFSASASLLLSSGTHPSARHHVIQVATATVWRLYCLAACPASLGAISVAQVLLIFFGILDRS